MDPSGDAVIQLFILLILLALSAFFSSSETALVTVNKIRMRNMAEGGNKQAETVIKTVENQGKMLSAILIGNNVVNLSASSLATVMASSLFGNKAVGIATGILTLLILVFGEITPKTMATYSAEKISLKVARYIYFLMTVLTPVIFLVNLLSGVVLKLCGVNTEEKRESITEDELRTIVEVSHEEGVLETEEKKMITNVFDFGESLAKDIMVPRVDMTFAQVDDTYDQLLEIYRKERYTRIPVYEDSTDNVIGIINVKDLLLLDSKEDFHIRDYLRQPLYTYEYKKASELMLEMRKSLNNIVIVLDEYGATAGLITLEDMLEEIVGDIRDEYDSDEEESLVEIKPGVYRVNASMKLDDLNDRLELHLQSEEYDSLGGLVIGLLDHLPEEGEKVEEDGLQMTVEHVDKNRIETIILTLPAKEEPPVSEE
ncbi:MAG TPA: HlyC/CorC family transporter [Candidatus Cottocaccamicrobium excrementipullorum]|nr:HlyC/CorC family transporter [Candidatus Cottocaccamicrobium excrementipullorum]